MPDPVSASQENPVGPPVVITRPLLQATGLAQRVELLGRQAIVFPLLDILPLPDTTMLQQSLAALDRYAMLAFISPNAIDAAFAAAPDWPAALPPDCPLAVMGEGSRAALARYGLTNDNRRIISPRNPQRTDSETLLEALDLNALRGKRVLVLRGETGRELLGVALRTAGIEVDQVAAYRRMAPHWDSARATTLRQLMGQRADWVVTSSEALRILLEWVREADGEAGVMAMQRQRLFVPHRRIVESARQLGISRVVLTQSGDDGLLAALQSLR
ncbi:MAG: hemD [Herminiimonas sp.]|nr:hemD [Herminiimonas sp.]